MAEGRKIAAILVADVVGYSRLAGVDEEGTLQRLRALRGELFNPAIDGHGGRVVKRTGDGVIVEFRSVVEAVRCALDVTKGLAARNADEPPDRRIEVRTGIHLGDVIEEPDGDLMGDGVNIAARIEGICAPGGICLSEDAWRQVRDKLSETFVDLGERQLKNIIRPMRVFALGGAVPAVADSPIPTLAPDPPRAPVSAALPRPSPVPEAPQTPRVPTFQTAAIGVLESVARLVGAYASRALTATAPTTRQSDPASPAARETLRQLRKSRNRTFRRMIIAAAVLTLLAARACHGPQIAYWPPDAPRHARFVR